MPARLRGANAYRRCQVPVELPSICQYLLSFNKPGGSSCRYSILKHGVRSMSGTHMQLNGAAYGQGEPPSPPFS